MAARSARTPKPQRLVSAKRPTSPIRSPRWRRDSSGRAAGCADDASTSPALQCPDAPPAAVHHLVTTRSRDARLVKNPMSETPRVPVEVAPIEVAREAEPVPPPERREVVFDIRDLSVSYGGNVAFK